MTPLQARTTSRRAGLLHSCPLRPMIPMRYLTDADALTWLEESRAYFDFIVVDFPDPANFALGKLYTSAFYRLLEKRLSAHGLIAIQSTSPGTAASR